MDLNNEKVDEIAAVPAPPPPESKAASPLRRSLIAALGTTAAVTAVSYAVPDKYAATAVGLVFLASVYALVLRKDETTIRSFGLSLGGLLEPSPLSFKRLLRDSAQALLLAALLALVIFPFFWYGYRTYWHVRAHFVFRWPASPLDEIAGQFLVIALPEEAFFRGYLQTSLDEAFPSKKKILGAELGLGWLISAAIFAVGHVLTTPHPARLAVFFPALVFGWLRARTGGIGAGTLFHALCNLFSAALARGYGLSP